MVSQLVFVCLTYSLLQVHLLRQGHEELNRRTWPTSHRLLPDGDRVIIYRQQYFGFFTLLEHMELTLSLEGKARHHAFRARRTACCMNPCPTQPSPITPSRRFPATAGLRLNSFPELSWREVSPGGSRVPLRSDPHVDRSAGQA